MYSVKLKVVRFCMLLVATWMATTVSAQRPAFSKMSPLVRQAAMDATMVQRRAAGSHDGRRMTAFVRIEPKAADSLLAHHGCRKLAQWGDIVIADIPLSRLRMLSAEPQVLRIEAGRQATAQMDTTLSIVNALPVYEATTKHGAYQGEGVVVGLMDIGFDLTHPNFRDAETKACRISAFWDQLSPDTVGSLLPVGRDYVGRAEVLAQHPVARHPHAGFCSRYGCRYVLAGPGSWQRHLPGEQCRHGGHGVYSPRRPI